MRYERVTLDNGVRVLVQDMPDARSASIAVYVGVGSRAETKLNAGTSHFLEHMVFKGTANRPSASEISQQIEGVGGSVNASTDKEATVFSSFVPARHYLLALDVVSDMVRAPLLRESDVESERNVIVEEIRMYRDQAQDRVHTLFLELREKRALAYDVHSYISNFSDAGHIVIYAGVAPTRAREAVAAALGEVARLRAELVPEAELLRVRDFVKGRIELRLEHSRGVSSWLAGQELFLDRIRSVEELVAIIDGISADDIQRVAQGYLQPDLAYLAA